MHKEILTKKQTNLLPLIKNFSKDFYLVGGTAISLHIGHRQSIDFDLFSCSKINDLKIKSKIEKHKKIEQVLVNNINEYSILVLGIKITFLYYPFKIKVNKKFNDIHLPDLLILACMKAYALGRRAKWKDYVDLYFIMKNHYPIKKIIVSAKKIFGKEFNEKNFRSQLSYFKDIDYSEKINYLSGFEIDDEVIKKELIKFSLEI